MTQRFGVLPLVAGRGQAEVLTLASGVGALVSVEPDVSCYVVTWPAGAARPLLRQSRGYPEHRCAKGTD